MQVFGAAIIPPTSPSDVVIVRTLLTSEGVVITTGVRDDGVAIARVNQPALTCWLRDAINQRLQGRVPDRPRPPGMLLERGAFVQDDRQVLARDWYGGDARMVVAHGVEAAAAQQLTMHLNALLAPV